MRFAPFLLFLSLSSAAWAQEPTPATQPAPNAAPASAPVEAPKPPVGEWKASVGASALMNTGNSENTTFGGNGLASYKFERNKLESTAIGAYGRAKSPAGVKTTNTKNWKIQERYDRYILDPLSIFAFGHLGQDRPSGIDWRYGGATGLSHEAYKVDPHFFKYELGFDYTRELRTPPPDVNRYSARIFLGYKYKLSDWAAFGESLENLVNVKHGKAYRLDALSTLTMKLTTKVAFQFGFDVRFDNAPPVGKKKTDTSTQAGLVITLL
ncbi:MAG: DUF481 domain-containing protein [Pseudomonadota bacterium]